MKIQHLQTGKESEISYHYWTHEFLNKGSHERYLVLDHGDLVAVNEIQKGERKYLYLLDRDHALGVVKSHPHRYEIDEQERTEEDKFFLILQYLISRSDNKRYCFDSEEVACGTGILPDEARYLLEELYRKGYVGNNTAKGELRRNVFSVSVTPKTEQVLKFGRFKNYKIETTQVILSNGWFSRLKSLSKFLWKRVELIHKIVSPIKSLILVGKVLSGLGIPAALFLYFNEMKGLFFSVVDFLKIQ